MRASSIVKFVLVTAFLTSFSSRISAQINWIPHYVSSLRKCGQPEAELLLQTESPHARSKEDYNQWMEGILRKGPRLQREVITIPIVVHVVHDDEAVGIGDNITSNQINSQIDVLNEDFRRRLNTNGYNNHPDGADVEIEFCMALVDPNGNPMPEPGIHRVNRLLENFSAPPYTISYHQNTIQQATYWDPTKYLNIWVSDLANDYLGFTILPGDTTAPLHKDGVTITSTAFGRKGTVAAPYNLGRTLTHEIGHWLGLIHVWGDGGCSVDDGCADTPESDQPNYGCPSISPVHCNSNDMYQNYMDYTDDACMNIFTQCQKNKMRSVMANVARRAALINSTVCQGTGAPLASFEASKIFACEGSQIQFTNQSTNTTTSWNWSFPGAIPDSSTLENPVVTYDNPGQYTVSLTVTNSIGNSSLTRTAYINITPDSAALLYEEDFENGLADWTVGNPDDGETWELAAVAGGNNGNYAASIRMFIYSDLDEVDELISPILDLSTYYEMELTFEHAYRAFTSGASLDSLSVLASIDGGSTYPFLLYRNAEDGNFNFATNATTANDFTPQSDEDWCYQGTQGATCNLIDLKQFSGEKDFRIKFVSRNGYGNNLYIDNVRLFGSCSPSVVSTNVSRKEMEIKVYPNPVSDILWIDFVKAEEAKVQLWNTMGQQLLQQSFTTSQVNGNVFIDMSHVAKGTYLLKIEQGRQTTFRKVVK